MLEYHGSHTPLLFLARTCSIVLSLFRGADLENIRTCAFVPHPNLVFCNPIFCACNPYRISCAVVARAVANALDEAKVRRAEVRRGVRSAADEAPSALAAPAMQLHEDAMSGLESSYFVWVDRLGEGGTSRWCGGVERAAALETFRDG